MTVARPGHTVEDAIVPLLRSAATRLRLERAFVFAVRFGLWSHVALLPWLALKPFGIAMHPGALQPSVRTYAIALIAVMVAGALVGLLRPLPLVRVARELDRRLQLEERLQSVLEFAHEHHRGAVRALIEDAVRLIDGMQLREAIPLRPPPDARRAGVAVALGALVLLLPDLQLGGLVGPVASTGIVGDARAGVLSSLDKPEDEPEIPAQLPPPREVKDIEFKDSPLESRSAELMRFEPAEDEQFAMLDPAVGLPRLQPDNDSASQGARGGARSRQALDFQPRRASQQEAAERLGELETLWGTPARPHEQPPALPAEKREQPEESGPAEEAGEEVPDHPVSEEETVEVNELHPDEERMPPQSDRFASLPEGMDAATNDLPPWPKGGPGEGQEDDSERDSEGTGRSSGKPGSGFAPFGRGPAAARFGSADEDEMRLKGLRQVGEEDSIETDLPALSTEGSSQMEFRALRARFTRRAEQSLSEEWVPFAAREQVKRYFRAIEARQ